MLLNSGLNFFNSYETIHIIYIVLHEFWWFVFFKELIQFICAFEFMSVELFIVLPYYSLMAEGSVVISHFIPATGSLYRLSFIFFSLARGLSILLINSKNWVFVPLIFSIFILFSISFISTLYYFLSSTCFG